MLRPSPRRSFYIVVSQEGSEQDWFWEIRRKRKPLGVKLREGGFRSHHAAQAAGRIALEDFLNGLAMDVAAMPQP
jgi:hypothetical protein